MTPNENQRKVIFEQRRELMTDTNLAETIADMRRQAIDDIFAAHIPEKSYAEQWDLKGLQRPCTSSSMSTFRPKRGRKKKASARRTCMNA